MSLTRKLTIITPLLITLLFNLATKTKLSEATTTIKNSEMDLAYTTKALSDKEKTKTTNDTSYQKNKQNMEKKEKEIQTLNVIKLSFSYKSIIKSI